MGRLRDCYEAPLFNSISEEVVDLYGVEDCYLYKFGTVDQRPVTDPLWGEPTGTARFKRYKIKCLFQDFTDHSNESEMGTDHTWESKIYVSVNHLIAAGVPKNKDGDHIDEGDAIRIHYKGDAKEYFVLQSDRTGWVNDSDQFTGYDLDVKRNDKYKPERATSDETGGDIF